MAQTLQTQKALQTPAENAAKLDTYTVGLVQRSILSLSGQYTQGASGSGAATYIEDGVPSFYQNIVVRRNGEAIVNASGKLLYYLQNYEDRVAPPIVTPTPADAAASYAFSLDLAIMHAPGDAADAAHRIASAVPNSADTNPEIQIQYGNADQIATGGTRAHTVTAPNVNLVSQLETGAFTPTAMRFFDSRSAPVTAASTNFQIEMQPQRDRLLHRVLIIVTNNSARSASLASNFKLKSSSSNVFVDVTATALVAANKATTKQTPPTGVYVIDFDPDGEMLNLPDMSSWSTFIFEAIVGAPTGTARIELCVVTIRKP